MANAEHVTQIYLGATAWNQWRRENPDLVPDMSHADLAGLDLDGYIFSSTKFEATNLAGATLRYADLIGAQLTHANLAGADLTGINRRRANIRIELITATNFNGANLAHANLSNAELYNAGFGGANLYKADLKGANLLYASFIGSQMAQADLTGACIEMAWFHGAHMHHANMADTTGNPHPEEEDVPAMLIDEDEVDEEAGGLRWGELEILAGDFTVRTENRREIVWLRQAWGHLAIEGLTDDETSMERARSVVRFLALGRAYNVFANRLLEQEADDPSYAYIIKRLGVPAFQIALLLDTDDADEIDDLEYIDNEGDFVSEAAPFLARAMCLEVWAALVKGYGGKDALYATMYLAVNGHAPDEDDGDEDLDEEDALSDVQATTLVAYQFVTDGFQE